MTRDHQGPKVWEDILAYVRDPEAPLPSGAPPIPKPRRQSAQAAASPGL